jgi:hypothetical protein
MRGITYSWRDHGLDLALSQLRYEGERNDVQTYLDDRDGARPALLYHICWLTMDSRY